MPLLTVAACCPSWHPPSRQQEQTCNIYWEKFRLGKELKCTNPPSLVSTSIGILVDL